MSTSRNCHLSAFVAFALVAGLTGPNMSASAGQILWRSAPTQTTPKSRQEIRETITALTSGGESRHVVIQFDGALEPKKRAELESSGLRLLRYLGNNAFFATFSIPQVDAAALTRTSSIVDIRPVERAWKLHPTFAAGRTPPWAVVSAVDGDAPVGPTVVGAYVLFHPDVPLVPDGVNLAIKHGAVVRSQIRSVNGLVVELPLSQIPAFADEDAVQWIEPPLPPMDEVNDSVRENTQAEIVQAPPYGLDGTGVNVLVYDAGTAAADHPDFGGRLSVRDGTGEFFHPTHVSCTIGGDGAASGGLYRGMAPNVTLQSYGFEYDGSGTFLYTNPGDIESDYDEAVNVHGAHIANNSIGTNTCRNGFDCEITGDYGVTAQLIDAIVHGSLGAPFRVVWANGNERGCGRCGDEGVHTLEGYHSTAPPACAKNHITVGALNSNDDSVTSFTSWGPTDDGRLKPDVSAPGCQQGSDNGVTSCIENGVYDSFCGT
ncbi:MAG: S8 family serine peptidase, partial [Planctomycetes bacterium]|nr:S8 family serine peptidase [Planctomycetota bacterium]